MAEEDYYTPPQVARMLRLSRRRVTQMLNGGQLEGEQSENGRWKISASAVDALLKNRSAPTTVWSGLLVAEAVKEVENRVSSLERRMERLGDALNRSLNRSDRAEQDLRELRERVRKLEEELRDRPSK